MYASPKSNPNMCSMSSSDKPLLVGITGGMGSGKTTVLQCFEELGVPYFSADRVASEYYNDADFCKSLRTLFGDSIFNADGTPDKKAIANIVFHDKAMLEQLNALVHPRVMSDFQTWCEQHRDAPYVLFESAIIFENNLQKYFDKIICVYAPVELRVRRIIKRDKTTAELALARINNQLSDESKANRSHYIIRNYYGPKHRRKMVGIIHEKILKYRQKQ